MRTAQGSNPSSFSSRIPSATLEVRCLIFDLLAMQCIVLQRCMKYKFGQATATDNFAAIWPGIGPRKLLDGSGFRETPSQAEFLAFLSFTTCSP